MERRIADTRYAVGYGYARKRAARIERATIDGRYGEIIIGRRNYNIRIGASSFASDGIISAIKRKGIFKTFTYILNTATDTNATYIIMPKSRNRFLLNKNNATNGTMLAFS